MIPVTVAWSIFIWRKHASSCVISSRKLSCTTALLSRSEMLPTVSTQNAATTLLNLRYFNFIELTLILHLPIVSTLD